MKVVRKMGKHYYTKQGSISDHFFSNAFIVPVVYFFYPETAYRSLEEMDSIFHKTDSIFSAVRIANEEPRRYGKRGELLIDYAQTEEHRQRASRSAHEKGFMHNNENVNSDSQVETGMVTEVSQ